MSDKKSTKEPFVVCTNCNVRVRANTCDKNMFCDCCRIKVNGNANSFEVTGDEKKFTVIMEDPQKYLVPQHLLWI